MKLKSFTFLSTFLLIVSCATQNYELSNKKEIHSVWKGDFISDFHTDGKIIKWILFTDGTMEGTWETKKGSSTINISGSYKINNDEVSFEGSGTLKIYDNTRSKVEISGKGLLLRTNAKGEFHLVIEHPKFREDNGQWYMTRIITENPNSKFVAISKPPPVYPDKALQDGIEGWVKVEFEVNVADGTAVNPRVVESFPNNIFDTAVLEMLSKWKFKLIDGQEQTIGNNTLDTTINFKISK